MSDLSSLLLQPPAATAADSPQPPATAPAESGMATADNTRRRLSVDFLLNGGSDGLAAAAAAAAAASASASDASTTDAQCCDDTTSAAGDTASASPSTNTSPRSSGAHATRTTRCADVLPPLSSLLSNSAPAVATKTAAHAHARAQRAAHQHHGRRRSWSTGGVVRPSAFIPPIQSCWSGANPPPERRPVVTVATTGPLARGPPPPAQSSSASPGFFLPITALPVVLDIDRDFEAAEREHRQQHQQQQCTPLHHHHQLHPQQQPQFQRQRRPQHPHPQHLAMTMAMMQKRKREQQLKAIGELDQDEVEVARMLADPNRWAASGRDPASAHQRPAATAAGRDHHQPTFAAEAETVMSPAEDARRMQHYHHQAKRRRHSACTPTLVAEAQRLFSSHLAATPILPASEAKELAAAKYGTTAASAASSAVDAMDVATTTPAPTTATEQGPAVDAAIATTGDAADASCTTNVNDNAPPAIAPTYRKAEAFQFSPDQQDLLLQVLERTQQREAQRGIEAGGHNSEMDIGTEGRSNSISSGSSSSSGSSGGSSSGDDGDDDENDEAARLQRMAKKRKRVNAQQLAVLEEYFAVDPMPNTLVKLKLAETLGMSPKRVQIWFQNKRARLKKGEQKKLQDALQQQQTNQAGSRLLTYHNLRIDESGHIVIKDPTSADGGGESVTSTPPTGQDQEQHQQFVPIMPQPTTTASAM